MLNGAIAVFLAAWLDAAIGLPCEQWAHAIVRDDARAEATEAPETAQTPDTAQPERIDARGAFVIRGSAAFRDPLGSGPELDAAVTSIRGSAADLRSELEIERALHGVQVLDEASHEFLAGAAGTNPITTAPAPRYRLREYTLVPPGGYLEPFILLVPSPLPATPRPLVVVFHKFGSSHLDVLQNTDFVRQCARRGWFLVCPTGASRKHFGSLESQANTEAVLEWIRHNPSLRIDEERIYGVGFSMGGGAALSYAARHRDPAGLRFAALINHSGGVALNHTYLNEPSVRWILDFWYGDGSVGSAQPWRMTRSSALDFDPTTLSVDPTSDMVRNLGSTPLSTFCASADPILYLPVQNDVLDVHLRQGLGRASDPNYAYQVVPFASHEWGMLDASAACDWFAQHRLTDPTAGRLLADQDGVFEQFLVEQDQPGAFTPLDWSLDASANRVELLATANLTRVTLDPIAAGLSTGADLELRVSSADGTGGEFALAHWPASPSQVLRDGVASTAWTYDASTRELVLLESDAALHVWTVVP